MIDRRPCGRAVLDGALVDSATIDISWSDPAAQWGLGVFETIAVHAAAPRHLEDHLQRLESAARKFGVPLPAATELERAAHTVAAGADEGQGWLKILVSRSGRWAVCAGPFETAEHGRALSAVVLPWRRHRLDPTVGIKSLAYAPAILGLEEAQRRGADEGLWRNERGHLIGACTGNLFVVRGRAVVTPALSDGARDGVTRRRSMGVLREFGLSVRQSNVRIATLRGADEVILTSSLGGVRAVVRIDGRDVRSGVVGRVSIRLAERLAALDVAPTAIPAVPTERGS